MKVKVHQFKYNLKTIFSINYGSYAYRSAIILELTHNHHKGYGETVAIDYYGLDINIMHEMIQKEIPKLNQWDVNKSTQEFYDYLTQLFPNQPFLQCAFDCAYWDLKARMSGLSLQDYAKIPHSKVPLSSITIGINENQKVINQKLEEQWPVIKLKIRDHSNLNLIPSIVTVNKQFGIDANGSIPVEELEAIQDRLVANNALYLEQPVKKGEELQLAHRFHTPKLITLADESIQTVQDLERIGEYYDGFVLKLTKCGGITPVLEIIKEVKRHGKKLLAGCMTESTVGINNMLSLGPYFDYADLDGAFLISNDPFNGRKLQTNGYFDDTAFTLGNGVYPL